MYVTQSPKSPTRVWMCGWMWEFLMKKTYSGKTSTVIHSSHSDQQGTNVKSALNICKTKEKLSTFVEIIHILLSSWVCILLIWLSWSHFLKLANSLKQTYPDRDYLFFRKFLTSTSHLTNWSVMSAQFKCVMLFCTLSRWFINLFPYFIMKSKESYCKSIIYEGLYWKVMHSSSIWKRKQYLKKETKNDLIALKLYLATSKGTNHKNHILNKEWQTDIYCNVFQSYLVWWQGTLACNILFTVHYMT